MTITAMTAMSTQIQSVAFALVVMTFMVKTHRLTSLGADQDGQHVTPSGAVPRSGSSTVIDRGPRGAVR